MLVCPFTCRRASSVRVFCIQGFSRTLQTLQTLCWYVHTAQDIDAAYLFQDMGDIDDDLSSLLVPDLDFTAIASGPVAPPLPKLPQQAGQTGAHSSGHSSPTLRTVVCHALISNIYVYYRDCFLCKLLYVHYDTPLRLVRLTKIPELRAAPAAPAEPVHVHSRTRRLLGVLRL